MARDSKTRNKAKPRGARGGTLLGVFIGLVLGVLIALGIAWYVSNTPVPFMGKGHPEPGMGGPGAPTNGSASGVPGPLSLPGKPGDQPGEKPRFEFYKILPEGEQAAPAPANAAPGAPAAKGAEPLYLQVGAFQKASDADNLKARLALMGLEASVQQVDAAEKGILHRVRVGPFRAPDEMNPVRAQLAQNGLQASIVKGRD